MPLFNCWRRSTRRRVFGVGLIVTVALMLHLMDTHITQLSNDEQLKTKRHSAQKTLLSGNPITVHDFAVDATNKTQFVRRFTENDSYLSKLVVLTTTNNAYIDFTENWLSSIRRIGNPHPNIHIVAEDQLTFDALRKSTAKEDIVHIQKPMNLSMNMTLTFDTPDFKKFCNKRPQYILNFLKMGRDVLFSDVDIVWFARPYNVLYGGVGSKEGAEIYIMEDLAPPNQQLCAGFVIYRSTNATIRWVEKWISEIDRFDNVKPDQMVLNMMVKGKIKDVPAIKMEVLNPDKFVSGQYYFNTTWREENPHVLPVVVHNNWIVGHDNKVRRFKELGRWYITS